MNIKCCICHELFVPSDDVYFTPCGHFFHFPCVSHWLERSKSCPHCRTKVTERSIHRAYFDFSSTDNIEVDTTVLTSRIDSLNFQLLLKDKDLKTCGDDNATLKKQAAGLRAEVRKLEADIEKQKSAIYAFKEQTKYFKNQSLDCEAAKKEILRLKKNLSEYRNVQMLISDSQDDVDRMLSDTQDKTALVTYVSVLKREMESNVVRRRELRERIKRLEREMLKVKAERDDLLEQQTKCRQLQEDLAHCENEKQSLWMKLQELQSQLRSNRKISSEDVRRFIAESPAPERVVKNLRANETLNTSACDTTCPEPSQDSKIITESQEQSPEFKFNKKSSYPSAKAPGASDHSTLSKQSVKSKPCSTLSILTKKPRLTLPLKGGQESKDMQYDGYGGHSKVDKFPSPILRFKSKVIKNNLMSVKVKRRKLPDGTAKKLDDYLIDLT